MLMLWVGHVPFSMGSHITTLQHWVVRALHTSHPMASAEQILSQNESPHLVLV